MRRLMLIALAAGSAVALFGTASVAEVKPAAEGSECVIEYVDERGGVRDTSTAKEGTAVGEFRCVGGVWQYSFDRDEFVTAPRVQADPEGKVTAPEWDRPARARRLTLGEMADIARVVTGAREAATFQRAVVAVKDGRERTPEEIEAILEGRDTTGARILRTFDRVDASMTVHDIVGDTGTDETTVVYLLGWLWDAIVDAVTWVIDTAGDVYDWFDDHCDWFPRYMPGLFLYCWW